MIFIFKEKPMKFTAWLKGLFQDERGSASIKPVIGLMGAIFLCVSMVLNAAYPTKFIPSSDLINVVMIITTIGMGADTFDKFSYKKPLSQNLGADNGMGNRRDGDDHRDNMGHDDNDHHDNRDGGQNQPDNH